jgi:hypothetical protein
VVRGVRLEGDGRLSDVPSEDVRGDGDIVFQMGRARLAARGTTLKSTTLARPEARLIVLSAGTTR